jgi:hypothetical protein
LRGRRLACAYGLYLCSDAYRNDNRLFNDAAEMLAGTMLGPEVSSARMM